MSSAKRNTVSESASEENLSCRSSALMYRSSTVVAAASAALGGEAGGPEALVDGLRWGLYACVGFAVLALPVVLMGLPRSVASTDSE
jgi:hypothetical protein